MFLSLSFTNTHIETRYRLVFLTLVLLAIINSAEAVASTPSVDLGASIKSIHLRGAKTATQVKTIEHLYEQTGGQLAVRFDDNGNLSYLAGINIAPLCQLNGILDELSTNLLLKCFIDTSPELFPGQKGDQGKLTWEITNISPPAEDKLTLIHVQQTTGGYDVKGADIVLTLRGNKLVSYGGTLFTPKQVALSHLQLIASTDAIEKLAGYKIGKELQLIQRIFDPKEGEMISYLIDPKIDGQMTTFGEVSGKHEVFELGANHHPTVVSSRVAMYDKQWAINTTMNAFLDVDLKSSINGRDCTIALDAGSDNTLLVGNPKTALANGGSSNGSVLEDTSQFCRHAFSGYHPSNSRFSSTRKGKAANVHFWMTDLAKFTRHWRAAYSHWYRYSDPENLKVVLQENASCGTPPRACIRPTIKYFGLLPGKITEWRILLPEDKNSHDDLQTMAHEMGHFVGYNYKNYHWLAQGGLLERATQEGFAEHNVLRYAMFRHREISNRPHDSLFSSTFFTNHWKNNNHIVRQVKQNGESVAGNINALGRFEKNPAFVYQPWKNESPCNARNSSEESAKYLCASIIGSVYWTLAWNQIRVGFNTLRPGQELLSASNSYYSNPERLANVAFTYAAATISGNAKIPEFFDRVAERYWRFFQEGVITGDEVHRINQVMTASCVGWSDHVCRSRHITTEGTLPVMFTLHNTLSSNPRVGGSEFIRAQNFSARGGASFHTFNDGANDNPPAMYAKLDNPGEFIEKSIHITVAGDYKLHAAAQIAYNCCDSAWIEIDNNGVDHYWNMDRLPTALRSFGRFWLWQHNGPVIRLSRGSHNLKIKYRENVSIEAILLERVR